MTTTTAHPLFSDQERDVLDAEASRKGWQTDLRVRYAEHGAAFRIPGRAPMLEPEWSVDVTARRTTARITATIYEADPDAVRLLTRRFIEGLPE